MTALVNVTDHTFVEPTKQINDQRDVTEWKNTEAFSRFMLFIEQCNEGVVNKKISDPFSVSEVGKFANLMIW